MTIKLENKILAELNNNRIWRAKEILQGNISNMPYDKDLYYEYAKILYSLGDYLESGKYFLLSYSNEDTYDDAINLFLHRYGVDEIFYQLPRQFKKVEVKNYPQRLQNLILGKQEIIATIKYHQKRISKNTNIEIQENSNKEDIVIGLVVAMVIITFLVGIATIGRFVWSML